MAGVAAACGLALARNPVAATRGGLTHVVKPKCPHAAGGAAVACSGAAGDAAFGLSGSGGIDVSKYRFPKLHISKYSISKYSISKNRCQSIDV